MKNLTGDSRLSITIIGIVMIYSGGCKDRPNVPGAGRFDNSNTVIQYTFEIISSYPHDQQAFIQGLAIEDGFWYEGTGLYGQSSLRKVEIESGAVIKKYDLPAKFFGEGITIFGDRIIQLTWQSGIGFVYDKDTFEIIRQFKYNGQGWGLTHDDNNLIMSDGTSSIYFLDPNTFERVKEIKVLYDGRAVSNLNELECIAGLIYANVWGTNYIAIISPQSGQVQGWIDLTGLYQPSGKNASEKVLNGIAFDKQEQRLFVTGKLWPKIFEIRLIEQKNGF